MQNYMEQLTHLPDDYTPIWTTTRNVRKPFMIKPPIKGNNHTWIMDEEGKSNAFADHLENTFTPNKILAPPELIEGPLCKNDQLKFTLKDITNQIQNLKNKKAPGIDKIKGRALKSLPLNGHIGIRNIFNAALNLNYFPEAWKKAKIIVLPKPGKDPYLVASYRPISLLPILSKILERLILEVMQDDLEKLMVIPQHQFGFRRQHGTIEQVHKIVNEIKQALERKQLCVGIFLDVAQAFDKVNHEGLLKKLYQLLPIRYHKILKSYIEDRTFQVQYGEAMSTTRKIKAGVPQGSVLGPVLYLIYTSDLPTDDKVITTTFADDTAILYTSKEPGDAHTTLQRHVDKVSEWCSTWGIKLNETKTTQVTFTLKRATCPPILINNRRVITQAHTKYLGIHLDSKLNWKLHISKKKEQLNLALNKMKWLLHKKSKISVETKLMIYKVILKPVWAYGVQLWGSAKDSNLAIIDRLQNKIIRLILGAPKFIRTDIILRDVDIPKVKTVAGLYCSSYIKRLAQHPNNSARKILTARRFARLKRNDPLNLINNLV